MAKVKKSEKTIVTTGRHAVRLNICENIYTYETKDNSKQEEKKNDLRSDKNSN